MHDELTKRILKKWRQRSSTGSWWFEGSPRRCKEARAQGDLSENFEYKAAKKFKNENESRIRYLEK